MLRDFKFLFIFFEIYTGEFPSQTTFSILCWHTTNICWFLCFTVMYSLLAQHFTMSCAESTDCPGQVRRRSVKPAAVQYCLLLSVTGSHYCHCGPCAPHKAAPRMSLVATGGLRVRTQTQAPLLLISNAAPSIGTKPATQQQDCHRALLWWLENHCTLYQLFVISDISFL